MEDLVWSLMAKLMELKGLQFHTVEAKKEQTVAPSTSAEPSKYQWVRKFERPSIKSLCVDVFHANSNQPMHWKSVFSSLDQSTFSGDEQLTEQQVMQCLNSNARTGLFKRVAPGTYQLEVS